MGFLVGMRDIARYLTRMLRSIPHKREDRHRIIAVLLCQNAEINRPCVDARRGTGFQAADAQRQFTQTTGQRDRRRIACTAAAVVIETNMDLTVKKGSDSQYYRFGAEFKPHLGDGADNTIVLNNQIFHRLLEDH